MSKYKNVRTEVDGIVFDSKLEAERYVYLRAKEDKGEIRDLECQPSFTFPILGEELKYARITKTGKTASRTVTYRADFSYWVKHTVSGVVHWEQTVEDVKGMTTGVWKLKWALVKAIHPRTRFLAIRKKKGFWDEDIS